MKSKIATKIDPSENFISTLISLGNKLRDLMGTLKIGLETHQLVCQEYLIKQYSVLYLRFPGVEQNWKWFYIFFL